jgi:CRISPR-associated protein Cmr1
MRKQPPSPPPVVTAKPPENVITEVREYELITPLFGGGVNPTEADELTVVRATEVRGHLRFWWRACHAGKFNKNLATMKQAEDTLWGAAYKKGDPIVAYEQIVQIVVEPIQQGNSVKPFRIEKRQPKPVQGIPAYAAFPLQPDRDELKKQEPHVPSLREHVSFSLTISFPADRQKEAKAALWAWETFGGIGARTRRGFGALRLLRINGVNYTELPLSHQVTGWIEKNIINFVEPGTPPAGVPYLNRSSQFVVMPRSEKVGQAWKRLIDKLVYFRQARQGRSTWPEAESIRRITGKRDPRYRELPHPEKFPRAAFGLPIIFHFKDEDDPEDTTLKEDGEKKVRFASPLILRPFLCRDNWAVGLALLLDGSRIDYNNLVLEEQDGTTHLVQAMLTMQEAKNIPVLDGKTDVLQAFMNDLKGVKQ